MNCFDQQSLVVARTGIITKSWQIPSTVLKFEIVTHLPQLLVERVTILDKSAYCRCYKIEGNTLCVCVLSQYGTFTSLIRRCPYYSAILFKMCYQGRISYLSLYPLYAQWCCWQGILLRFASFHHAENRTKPDAQLQIWAMFWFWGSYCVNALVTADLHRSFCYFSTKSTIMCTVLLLS